MNIQSKKYLTCVIILSVIILACNLPTQPSAPNNNGAAPTSTPKYLSTETPTIIPPTSQTPTNTPTFTPTLTPLPTETPPPTFTPTPEFPTVTADMNAFCRWGPGTAYITSGVPLLEGQTARVDGRDYDSTWYWIQIESVNWHCWISASTVTLQGDSKSIKYVQIDIPTSNKIPSPKGVSASRNGNLVTISWQAAPPAPELGYLIEAEVCLYGSPVDVAYSTTNTAITLEDNQDCSKKSSGTVYTVNKLGYSKPVPIAWP